MLSAPCTLPKRISTSTGKHFLLCLLLAEKKDLDKELLKDFQTKIALLYDISKTLCSLRILAALLQVERLEK